MNRRQDMNDLLNIMARLRDPNGGCPWDVQQNFASVAPYTIEETYEVVDAIDRGHMGDLCEELGDLLLQVVFHAQMAAEAGHFSFADVVDGIANKMLRRHPHVFGDAEVRDAEAQTAAWEAHKRAERGQSSEASALDGLASGLPEWIHAQKLQKRGASVGFTWTETAPILDKLREEVDEVEQALVISDSAQIEAEIGDVMFVAIALARRVGAEPSRALRGANRRYEARFRCMEQSARAAGTDLSALSLGEQSKLWNQAKEALGAAREP